MRQAERLGEAGVPDVAAHHIAGVRARVHRRDRASRAVLLERARELHDPAQHEMYIALTARTRHGRARDVEPAAVGARLSRSRDGALPGRRSPRPMRSASRCTRLRAARAQGVLVYRGERRPQKRSATRTSRSAASTGFRRRRSGAASFQGCALISLGRIDEGRRAAARQRGRAGAARDLIRQDDVPGAARRRAAQGGARRRGAGGRRRRVRLRRAHASSAASSLSCTACAASCCSCAAMSPAPKPACGWRSRTPAAARPGRSSCARQRRWRGCSASRGAAAEARDRLADVHDWFTEGFATADLVAARTLLSEMG